MNKKADSIKRVTEFYNVSNSTNKIITLHRFNVNDISTMFLCRMHDVYFVKSEDYYVHADLEYALTEGNDENFIEFIKLYPEDIRTMYYLLSLFGVIVNEDFYEDILKNNWSFNISRKHDDLDSFLKKEKGVFKDMLENYNNPKLHQALGDIVYTASIYYAVHNGVEVDAEIKMSKDLKFEKSNSEPYVDLFEYLIEFLSGKHLNAKKETPTLSAQKLKTELYSNITESLLEYLEFLKSGVNPILLMQPYKQLPSIPKFSMRPKQEVRDIIQRGVVVSVKWLEESTHFEISVLDKIFHGFIIKYKCKPNEVYEMFSKELSSFITKFINDSMAYYNPKLKEDIFEFNKDKNDLEMTLNAYRWLSIFVSKPDIDSFESENINEWFDKYWNQPGAHVNYFEEFKKKQIDFSYLDEFATFNQLLRLNEKINILDEMGEHVFSNPIMKKNLETIYVQTKPRFEIISIIKFAYIYCSDNNLFLSNEFIGNELLKDIVFLSTLAENAKRRYNHEKTRKFEKYERNLIKLLKKSNTYKTENHFRDEMFKFITDYIDQDFQRAMSKEMDGNPYIN